MKLYPSLVWVMKLQVINSLLRFLSVLDNCTFYSKMYSVKLLALEWKDPKSNKRNVLLFFFLCRLELELGKIYYNSLKRIDLVAQGKECKHSKVSQCCRIFFYLSCIVYTHYWKCSRENICTLYLSSKCLHNLKVEYKRHWMNSLLW